MAARSATLPDTDDVRKEAELGDECGVHGRREPIASPGLVDGRRHA